MCIFVLSPFVFYLNFLINELCQQIDQFVTSYAQLFKNYVDSIDELCNKLSLNMTVDFGETINEQDTKKFANVIRLKA